MLPLKNTDEQMMEVEYRRGFNHGLCMAYDLAEICDANGDLLDALAEAEEITFEFAHDQKEHSPLLDHIWQELRKRKNQAKNYKPRPDND